MKRKIVSVVLALCVLLMCVSLTACKSETAYSVIGSAVEKTQALDSMAAEMKIEMNMDMDGMTMSVPITADMKATELQSGSPKISSDISMSMLGQDILMSMYQEGDWAYIVVDDMKYKTNISEAESEYDYSDDMNDMLKTLPEELLKEVELVKNEDGSKTVTVSIPDEMFAEIYEDFLSGLDTAAGTEGAEIKISDAVVTITVANDYISVYDMKFNMDMEIEGIAVSTEVKATITYRNVGAEVTVTPPEGYESFEELSLTE